MPAEQEPAPQERLEQANHQEGQQAEQQAEGDSSSWAEALVLGALTSGVNKPTWAAVNLLILLVIATSALVVLPFSLVLNQTQPGISPTGTSSPNAASPTGDFSTGVSSTPSSTPPSSSSPPASSSWDVVVLLSALALILLAGVLLFLLNWVVAELGTVSVEEQKRQLGLTPADQEGEGEGGGKDLGPQGTVAADKEQRAEELEGEGKKSR